MYSPLNEIKELVHRRKLGSGDSDLERESNESLGPTVQGLDLGKSEVGDVLSDVLKRRRNDAEGMSSRRGDGRRRRVEARAHGVKGIVGEGGPGIVAFGGIDSLIVPYDEMAVFRETLKEREKKKGSAGGTTLSSTKDRRLTASNSSEVTPLRRASAKAGRVLST